MRVDEKRGSRRRQHDCRWLVSSVEGMKRISLYVHAATLLTVSERIPAVIAERDRERERGGREMRQKGQSKVGAFGVRRLSSCCFALQVRMVKGAPPVRFFFFRVLVNP